MQGALRGCVVRAYHNRKDPFEQIVKPPSSYKPAPKSTLDQLVARLGDKRNGVIGHVAYVKNMAGTVSVALLLREILRFLFIFFRPERTRKLVPCQPDSAAQVCLH